MSKARWSSALLRGYCCPASAGAAWRYSQAAAWLLWS